MKSEVKATATKVDFLKMNLFLFIKNIIILRGNKIFFFDVNKIYIFFNILNSIKNI